MSFAVCVRADLYRSALEVLERKTGFFFWSKYRFSCILFLSVHVGRVTRPLVLRLYALMPPYQFTPLLNLHSLILGLAPFGWLLTSCGYYI
jgi:hypothetical protein